MNRYRMYINGEQVESRRGAWFPVYDPSTEEIIAEVPDADAADVDRAVQAARAAFDSGAWPQTTAQDRGRLLFKLAERIRKEAPRLAELESRNCGKPIVEAEYDIARRRHLLRILRRPGHQGDGAREPGAGQCAEPVAARAGGRRRPDHPLELSAADGRLEAGAGAGRRLHLRAEAGRADAADGA